MKYSLIRIKIRQYKYQRGCRTRNVNILLGRKYINTIVFAKVPGIIQYITQRNSYISFLEDIPFRKLETTHTPPDRKMTIMCDQYTAVEMNDVQLYAPTRLSARNNISGPQSSKRIYSFAVQNLFSLMQSHLFTFSFVSHVCGDISNKILL